MELHFLGTTGYHPNRRRDTACLMLPDQGILLDAGTGIFRARDLIRTSHLDIFLTHVHLDHCIGLTFLLDVLYDRPVKLVRVWADPGKHAAIEQHLFAQDLFPVRPDFELLSLDVSTPVPLCGGGTLRAAQVPHPGGCLAFRLDWPGHSMAYVTDTMAGPAACYAPLVADVDLLVHECYFPDGWEDRAELTGHSCLTPVAQLAAAARAGQTWLVHLNPLLERDEDLSLDEARRICPALQTAEDGQVARF